MTVEYQEYMQSENWKQKKIERMTLDDYRCAMCGKPDDKTPRGLTVHHITYKNLTREPIEDLVTLCEGCHLKLHNYYNRYRGYEDKKKKIEIAKQRAIEREDGADFGNGNGY